MGPIACAAGYCKKTQLDGDISLHLFPKDPVFRRKWVKAVKNTRKWEGPSQFSRLCSEHFTPDCYEMASLMKKQMGLKSRWLLKSDAVPTLFKDKVSRDASSTSKREYSKKRQRKSEVEEMIRIDSLEASTSPSCPEASTSCPVSGLAEANEINTQDNNGNEKGSSSHDIDNGEKDSNNGGYEYDDKNYSKLEVQNDSVRVMDYKKPTMAAASKKVYISLPAADTSSCLAKLSEMQQCGLYCDVVLLAKTDTASADATACGEIRAHGCFLAAASDLFAGLPPNLGEDFIQRRTLHFEMLTLGQLSLCIDYIYGRKVQFLKSQIHEMAEAAELLQIPALLSLCRKIGNISPQGTSPSQGPSQSPETKLSHTSSLSHGTSLLKGTSPSQGTAPSLGTSSSEGTSLLKGTSISQGTTPSTSPSQVTRPLKGTSLLQDTTPSHISSPSHRTSLLKATASPQGTSPSKGTSQPQGTNPSQETSIKEENEIETSLKIAHCYSIENSFFNSMTELSEHNDDGNTDDLTAERDPCDKQAPQFHVIGELTGVSGEVPTQPSLPPSQADCTPLIIKPEKDTCSEGDFLDAVFIQPSDFKNCAGMESNIRKLVQGSTAPDEDMRTFNRNLGSFKSLTTADGKVVHYYSNQKLVMDAVINEKLRQHEEAVRKEQEKREALQILGALTRKRVIDKKTVKFKKSGAKACFNSGKEDPAKRDLRNLKLRKRVIEKPPSACRLDKNAASACYLDTSANNLDKNATVAGERILQNENVESDPKPHALNRQIINHQPTGHANTPMKANQHEDLASGIYWNSPIKLNGCDSDSNMDSRMALQHSIESALQHQNGDHYLKTERNVGIKLIKQNGDENAITLTNSVEPILQNQNGELVSLPIELTAQNLINSEIEITCDMGSNEAKKTSKRTKAKGLDESTDVCVKRMKHGEGSGDESSSVGNEEQNLEESQGITQVSEATSIPINNANKTKIHSNKSKSSRPETPQQAIIKPKTMSIMDMSKAILKYEKEDHHLNIDFQGLVPTDKSFPFASHLDAEAFKQKPLNSDWDKEECTRCKELVRIQEMTQHLELVHKVQTYLCHVCAATFTNRPTHRKHVNNHYREKRYKCPHCEYRSYREDGVLKHQKTHDAPKPYACEKCYNRYPTEAMLLRHKQRYHRKPTSCGITPSLPDRLICTICGGKFPSVRGVERHLTTDHGIRAPFKCYRCGRKFTKRGWLQNHFRRKHKVTNAAEYADIKLISRDTTHLVKFFNPLVLRIELCPQPGKDSGISCGESGNETLNPGVTVAENVGNRSNDDDNGSEMGGSSSEICEDPSEIGDNVSKIANVSETSNNASITLDNVSKTSDNVSKSGDTINRRLKSSHNDWKFSRTRGSTPLEAPDKLLCTICGAKFPFLWGVERHLKRDHGISAPFRCFQCGKKFSLRGFLQKHFRIKHKITNAAEYMDMTLISRDTSDLVSFINSGKDSGISCGENRNDTLNPNVTVTENMDNTLNNDGDDDGGSFSEICDEPSVIGDNVSKFVNVSETGNNAPIIKDRVTNSGDNVSKSVDMSSKSCDAINTHLKSNHNHQKSTGQTRDIFPTTHDGLICTICNAKFPLLMGVERHLKRDHGIPAPYKCFQCGRKFKLRGFLQNHFSIKHNTTNAGDFMDMTLISRDTANLVNIINPGKESGISCGENRNETLNPNDTVTENVDNTYDNGGSLSEICDDSSEIDDNMSKITTVSKTVSIASIALDNVSNSGDNFSKSVDTINRPLKSNHQKCSRIRGSTPLEAPDKLLCTICGAKFPFLWGIERHLRRDHSIPTPFRCFQCAKKFSLRGNLQKHLRRVHNIINEAELTDITLISRDTTYLVKFINPIELCPPPGQDSGTSCGESGNDNSSEIGDDLSKTGDDISGTVADLPKSGFSMSKPGVIVLKHEVRLPKAGTGVSKFGDNVSKFFDNFSKSGGKVSKSTDKVSTSSDKLLKSGNNWLKNGNNLSKETLPDEIKDEEIKGESVIPRAT